MESNPAFRSKQTREKLSKPSMGGDYDTPQISSRAIRIPGVMYPPRGSKTQADPKQCIVSSQLPEGDAQIRPHTGSNPTVTFAIQFKKCWTAGRVPVAGLTKPGYRLTKPGDAGHILISLLNKQSPKNEYDPVSLKE
jgi:hypothetical protein